MLNSVPGKVRIRVYERAVLGLVVEEVVSAPDGTWRVENLDRSVDYTVIGFDPTGVRNADIQDVVRPAAM